MPGVKNTAACKIILCTVEPVESGLAGISPSSLCRWRPLSQDFLVFTSVFHSSSQLMAHIFKLFIKLCYFITDIIREYSELEGTHQLSCCSKSKVALHSLIGILMCLHVRFPSPSLWITIVLHFIFEAAKGGLCIGCITFLITATFSFIQALNQTHSLNSAKNKKCSDRYLGFVLMFPG